MWPPASNPWAMMASTPRALEPERFLDRRGVADDDCAGGFHPLEQRRVGQAEMEADDLGPKLLDDRAHRLVERQAQRAAVARLDAELFIIRPQQRAPRAVVDAVRHAVAEEVEVERPARRAPRTSATCSRTWSGESSAHGSEPSAPPSIAATHSSTPPAPAIGAWMIGCSILTRSRKRRSGQFALIAAYLGGCGSIFTVGVTPSISSAWRRPCRPGRWGRGRGALPICARRRRRR